jgi:hypothetical protein
VKRQHYYEEGKWRERRGGDDIRGVIGVFISGSLGNVAGLPRWPGISAPLTHRQELK